MSTDTGSHHAADEDCTLGADGCCTEPSCGVSHGAPCSECGGRGFHRASCSESSNDEAYRAYDLTTEWSGPERDSIAAAESDATAHNDGCAKHGGYGSAIVVRREGNRMVRLDGEYVWPPHGRSNGAARWR